ncbi:RsmF rRNA methyltransferase first C-terminal domain-containing protein [Blautia sp.]|uniref:RsmF rRNA methyltransferase first C-terminal domain-containing protein n=1 Tax=Blautia sp. TaxID=1955243 RepID=UPI003A8F33FD
MSDYNITDLLSPAFLERMRKMLGDEYEDCIKSDEAPRTYGLRVNTAKISCEEFEKIVPFPVTPIPWIPNGYFYPEDVRPSFCPLYQAGLYYLQEPSAMTPASCLPITPGENVLDLCAAPGGKATALGAMLNGSGLLVANDISSSRTRALLRNVELFGITNAFVTNETPAHLKDRFPEFFHKILLDAPCSGEGMFRKEDALARDWTPEKSDELSVLQKELILQAADMLRPGGQLLYSTCTFAPKEDEGVVSYLLENRPDMKLMELPAYEGFAPGVPAWGNDDPALSRCVHLFPHKMQGEGHFMALFCKEGRTDLIGQFSYAKPNPDTRKWLELFFQEIGLKTLGGQPFDWNRVETRKDKVYYLPPVTGDFRGLTFLRNGLYLGDLKKNRFEPSEPFALALRKDDTDGIISLSVNDQRLTRYLKGETLNIEQGEAAHTKGWHLLCVEGYPLGFGKLVGNTFKNKDPAGWRV